MLFSIYDINVVLSIWCAAFSTVGLFCILLFSQPAQRSASWYRRNISLMFVFNMIAALSNAVAAISRGVMTLEGWIGIHLGISLTFASFFLLAGAFTSYLCARLEPASNDLDWWGSLVWAICGVGVALTVAGLFFTVDPATNYYSVSDKFWISQLLALVIQIGNLCVLLSKKKSVGSQTFFSMLVCIMLSIAAFFAQMFVSGLNLVQLAMTASFMILFVDLQTFLAQNMAQQQEILAQRERELSDSRVQIMVSQIQPHFLYNTLDSIYYLCGKDAMRAREAVSRFADYLRMNVRSLGTTSPVPFTTELDHVLNYIELERMSSDDTIAFEQDIQTTNFMLPALSLQPVVENAVKHGVTKKPEGGTITLRTREYDDHFEVTVEDDGVGFDTSAPEDTSRPHVGMQNVRERLKNMCGGTLEVTSEPGVGTVVTIKVPRGGV
ncbi:MAG: histidine kinase [Atopobiaceae bacterium]|nr:histidine kinase [Atopobiaceae bacterium]